jgi:hypothetical protein
LELDTEGESGVGQSKRISLVEAAGNTAIGCAVNLAVQAVVFPMFGIHISLAQNFHMVLIFTGVSIARGYVVRRVFERYRR